MPLQEVSAGDDKLLQDIADRLAKSHKILAITGAGISTSCGIPDFRSKDGLYNIILDHSGVSASSEPSTPSRSRFSSVDLPPSSQSSISSISSRSRRTSSSPASKLKGQDLFDASVWKNSHTTEVFYRFIASLRQKIADEVKEASQTHKFIRTLRDGGRLMRCYTQNIDGLERREGLSMDLELGKGTRKRFMKKIWEAPRPSQSQDSDADGGCEVVPLHGGLEVLRCTLCQETCPWSDEATECFLNGLAPHCSTCATKSLDRQKRGKRGVAVGSLRPNIVLYGEEHHSNESLAPLIPFDVGSGPEILIIMGTSLRVHGLQKMVKEFAKRIHARKDGKGRVIFINRTKPAESVWDNVIDSYVAMDCDDWVNDLKTRREDLFLRQGELDLNVTKPTTKKRKCSDESFTPSKRFKTTFETPSQRPIAKATPWKVKAKESKATSSLLTPPPSRGKGSVDLVDSAPTPEPLTPPLSNGMSIKTTMYEDLFRRLLGSQRTPKPSFLRNTWKPFVRATDGGSSPERPRCFSPIEERHMQLEIGGDSRSIDQAKPSLLRNTWKPFPGADDGGSSPERPGEFSPIEESRPELGVHNDASSDGQRKPLLTRIGWKPFVVGPDGGSSPLRPEIFSPIVERRTKTHMYEDPDMEIEESQDEDASVVETPTKTKPRTLRPSSTSSLNHDMVKERSREQAEKAASLERNGGGRGLRRVKKHWSTP